MKKRIIWSLGFSVLMIFCFSFSFIQTKKEAGREDIERIRSAVKEGILECYSIEGGYPKTLDYLLENYGVYLNEELYQIHYRYLGSNMIPEFAVFEKGVK